MSLKSRIEKLEEILIPVARQPVNIVVYASDPNRNSILRDVWFDYAGENRHEHFEEDDARLRIFIKPTGEFYKTLPEEAGADWVLQPEGTPWPEPDYNTMPSGLE